MKTTKLTPIKTNTKAAEIKDTYPKFRGNTSYNEFSSNLKATISDELDNIDIEADTFALHIKPSANSGSRELSFDCRNLGNCCGVTELGSLRGTEVPVDVIKNVFDEIASTNKGRTFIVNTTANQKVFNQALSRCEYFTLVKSFKNANTGNMINIWLSNNE